MKELVACLVAVSLFTVLGAGALDLEQSFDASVAAGHPLAAESAFRKLAVEKPSTAAIRYFRAAEVARELGNGSLYRDRLSHFLQSEKGWSAEVEQALRYLCRVDPQADRFARMAKNVPHDEALFRVGLRMLGRLREVRRGDEFVRLADALLETFTAKAQREEILRQIVGMVQVGAPGFPHAALAEVLSRYPLADSQTFREFTWNRKEYGPEWMLTYCDRHACLWQRPAEYALEIIQGGAWGKDRELAAKRDHLLSLFAKREADCFGANVPPIVPSLYYRTAIRRPKLFFSDASTNEQAGVWASHQAAQLFKRMASESGCSTEQLSEMFNDSINCRIWLRKDIRSIVGGAKTYGTARALLTRGPEGDLLAEAVKSKSAIKLTAFIRGLELDTKVPRSLVADLHWTAAEAYAVCGETAGLRRVFSDLVRSNPLGFNRDTIFDVLARYSAAPEAKVSILKDTWALTGTTDSWRKLIERYEQEAARRQAAKRGNPVLGESSAFRSFAQTVKSSKTKASDQIVRAWVEMEAMAKPTSGQACPARLHACAAEATAAYPGRFPDYGRYPIESRLYQKILDRYFDFCRSGTMDDKRKFLPTLVAKQGEKSPVWQWWFWQFPSEVRDDAGMNAYCRARVEVTGNWNEMVPFRLRKADEHLPSDVPFEKMDAKSLMQFAYDGFVAGRFSRSVQVEVLLTLLKAHPVSAYSREALEQIFGRCDPSILKDEAFLSKLPWEALEADVLEKGASSMGGLARIVLQLSASHGRLSGALKRYMGSIERMDAATAVSAYVALLSQRDVIPSEKKAETKTVDLFGPLVRTKFLPLLKSIPARAAGSVSFNYRVGDFFERLKNYEEAEWNKRESERNQSTIDLVHEVYGEYVRLVQAGAGSTLEDYRGSIVYTRVYRSALAVTNVPAMSALAVDVGSRWCGWVGRDLAISVLKKTAEVGAHEPLYLLANAIRSGEDAQLVATAVRLRAEVSRKLPGIYPVSEKDPAYPLYVAADELSRNNSESARALLKANLSVFEREAATLPPEFTAWAVDQLRLERGKKDELLQKARTIATQLLSNEAKIPPSLAAAMLLVRAETFRDQQNFEAAKLEYQSIRNNPEYEKTPAGRKAMFRAMDLQIGTGNAAGAEATLEYWLSQPDPEVQAEAHYFLARIAFERKDYEMCIKQLREVFAIDFTHTEARFLQGQWKLATNSEVDETEVMIGSLSDRTSVRPGQQLTITVQDRNLSIAGGGSSIPVCVTTAPGGDRERIYLYPSARDPNLFRGVIDVRLADAVISNLVLEVHGDDLVSYEIDPQFLANRGLKRNRPKQLRVVDDARLAIGAGAPRTDEAEAVSQVESLVSDAGAGEATALANTLRPGNPLYIAVSDKDRSFGGGTNRVSVSVETTSGDRLSSVALEEVAPCTGVFRGMVPTALPPPRAFASDTSVGTNPGDVINSRRSGKWKSLPDGQPGKWFEVDTMGSYLVSNVQIRLPAPAEVTAIRLSGSLGGDLMRLGALPATDPKTRLGLHYQTERVGGFRGEASIRDHMEKATAPRSTLVTNVVYRPSWNNQPNVARFDGAFMQPKDYDYLRFRIEPMEEAATALSRLWLAVAIDGKTVFTGSGAGLAGRTFACEVVPGVHRLEVFVTANGKGDAFRLLWEPKDSDATAIPSDWFDATIHPEIAAFVADRAVLRRTKEGFVATFAKPMRLRNVRWEFLGHTSSDVTIESMTMVDAEGQTILPVESDFSDAQRNETLEVAPGDRIVVHYTDEATSSGERKVLEKTMDSSFTDAEIGFYFEELVDSPYGGNPISTYREAYRFIPGDTLLVVVRDADLDVSDAADKVKVLVESASGERKTVTLLEQSRDALKANGRGQSEGVHTGFFVGLLRTAAVDDASAHKKAMRVRETDALTLTYEDRENTNPGVPCARTAKVQAIRATVPELTLFHTRQVCTEDKSAEAKNRLEQIRRRPGNEKIDRLYRTDLVAVPMTRSLSSSTNAVKVNVAAPVLVRVNDPSRARHAASRLTLEVVSGSELARAEEAGEEPKVETTVLGLGAPFKGVRLRRGEETIREARMAGSFNGMVYLVVGSAETASEDVLAACGRIGTVSEDARATYPALLGVNGNDTVRLRVLDGEKVLLERVLELADNASLTLMDPSWKAERTAVHVGERFFIQLTDADRDESDEPDCIRLAVTSLVSRVGRTVVLTETMPHSGVFNGVLRPVLFAPDELIPSVVTGGVGSTEMMVADDRFAARYGDSLVMSYTDARTLAETGRTLCLTGTVYRGSNGDICLFSKRFRDADQAVQVQFRLAECLFEQAKEHRKLKQSEKSAEAIAQGRYILEEALKNYPDSSHLVQGEYLLANLYQELATEQKESGDMEKARTLYSEALARFSQLLAVWPEGEYAARAQYHKALCLEMLGDYRRASEEYVKMTYLYPESELVGDATIRLATYYYKEAQRYDVSAHIYENFQKRFPTHEKAPRALFMCGSCYVKEAEKLQSEAANGGGRGLGANASLMYLKAVNAFDALTETYRQTATPELRAQALYWAGDISLRRRDARKSYLYLKRTVLEYPETEWARRARGLLLQEAQAFEGLEEE